MRIVIVLDIPNFCHRHLSLRSRSTLENILTLEFGDLDFRPGEEYVTRNRECDVRVNHIVEFLFTDCVQHTAAIRLAQQHWDPSTLLFERQLVISRHS